MHSAIFWTRGSRESKTRWSSEVLSFDTSAGIWQGKHCMEGIDPDFHQKVKTGDIVVRILEMGGTDYDGC